MNLQPYLDFVTLTAYHAGRMSLGYFNTGITPDVKVDNSPVTAADRAVEEYIRTRIEEAYPSHAVLGEEYGDKGAAGNSFRWIIDPIDGTKSFVHGVPLYAVLIGLEIEGLITVGAAYFPALDEMLCGAQGLGCWWNGRRAVVSQVNRLQEACVCFTTYKNFVERDPSLWDRLSNSVYLLRGWSDAYGYLLVATGRAEICLDPQMAIWDCGPFPVIFQESGGFFGSWKGAEGHLHGEALACNAAIKEEILRVLSADSF